MNTTAHQPDPKFLRCQQAARQLAAYLKNDPDLRHHSQAMASCGDGMTSLYDPTRRRSPFFCHKRFCPVCQYRKVWKQRASIKTRMERAHQEEPQPRWMFLTLTLRDSPLIELRRAVDRLQQGFTRLRLTQDWQASVWGYMRFLEVVPSDIHPEYTHPHYHVILMVSPSMWGGKRYLSEARWTEIWARCLGQLDEPHVHCRRVMHERGVVPYRDLQEMAGYGVKPLKPDTMPPAHWMCEAIKQLRGVNMVTSGGHLRKTPCALEAEDTSQADAEKMESWQQDLQRILDDPTIPWAFEDDTEE